MFTRRLLLPLFVLLLFSPAALAQTRGGGGGRAPTGPAPIRTTPSPSTGNPNGGFPGSVPIHTADDEGKIEFRTEAILVQVPVVVTDKSGKHIHGLTKEDLHVYENGKEQKIATFEEIVSTSTKLPVVAPKPGEFTNLTLSEQQ